MVWKLPLSPSSSSKQVVVVVLLLLSITVVHGRTRTSRSASTTTRSTSVAACTLDCKNNAPCVIGNQTAVDLESENGAPTFHTTNANGQFCQCQPGWTGSKCETYYESCGGSHGAKCLNGGKCIKGLVDHYGNPQFLCDCSNATDANGNPTVGKYCEHPFVEPCDNQAKVFCVNGGECSLIPNDNTPCDCPDGYEGIHCEFKSGSVPNCTLSCNNGGECVLGILSPEQADGRYNFFEDNIEQYQRCVCPDNYEGLYCDIRKEPCGNDYCYNGGTCTDDETCDCSTADNEAYEGDFCQLPKSDTVDDAVNTTQQVECGKDMFCYNGGSCDTKLVNGEIQNVCDCSTAVVDGFSYVGQYCQYLSTNCDADCRKNLTDYTSISCGDIYCLNGASCVTQYDNGDTGNKIHNCSCTEGYTGTYCEYKVVEECNLECENGGVCIQGSLTDADADDNFNDWNNTSTMSYNHCLCPEGFDGDLCEIQHEQCGDNNQKCLNGGTCVKTTINGKNHYHCDCTSTIDENSGFAGRFCQYEASEICSRDTNNNALLFCVNGGVCIGDGFEGCACPENYTGFSCEFERASSSSSTGTQQVGPGSTATTNGWNELDEDGGDSQGGGGGDGSTSTTNSSGGFRVGPGNTATTNGGGTTATTNVGQGLTTSDNANAIDLCTTGVVPPGQPRYFCINGGVCVGYVPAGQPHPGCTCRPGWEGPHCEMNQNGNEAPKKALMAVKILLILVTFILFGIIGYYLFQRFSVRQRRFTAEERRRLKDEVNIAPHRESFTEFKDRSTSSSTNNIHAAAKSSSDPIASALASLPGAPEVYIGPPRDEDGHELHNVEII